MRFTFTLGTWADFDSLAHHHYHPARPANAMAILRATYQADDWPPDTPAGVVVVAYPNALSRGRHVALGIGPWPLRHKLTFINANIRSIARLIVHPTFRGLGLGRELVRRAVAISPVRYVEATAHMGRVCPVFTAAGFTEVAQTPPAPAYFLFDRSRIQSGVGGGFDLPTEIQLP